MTAAKRSKTNMFASNRRKTYETVRTHQKTQKMHQMLHYEAIALDPTGEQPGTTGEQPGTTGEQPGTTGEQPGTT